MKWSEAQHEFEVGENVYLDSETCGLHGAMVLLQWAVDDGPIHLYDVWKEPIHNTLRILEFIADKNVVMFNSAFDWFHVVKTYTTFRLADPTWIPEQHINEIAALEPEGRDGPCIKPKGTLDLLLHSRKGPYQSLMARKDINIRRVPTPLAQPLADELEKRVEIDGIYFAKRADKDAPKWRVMDITNSLDEVDPDFKNVVLKFNAAGGLKYLAEHALKRKPKFHYKDVEPPESWRPVEFGYAPTALAVSTPDKDWESWGEEDGKFKLLGYAWPGTIARFIDHWANHADAREYARDDIVYTRDLYHHFDRPALDDNDSVLACMVPVVRWRGFHIDIEGIKEQRAIALRVVQSAPLNVNAPGQIREYLLAGMDEIERVEIEETTKKQVLEAIQRWTVEEPEECGKCMGDNPECTRCGGSGTLTGLTEELPEDYVRFLDDPPGNHPAAHRAATVGAIRFAKKEIELFDKLLLAGRFHADFKVIGTLSSRMSGAGGLNAQGIKAADRIRSLFGLAWPGMMLSGGDFDSFEVTIADAEYADANLRKDLLSGKKIHALFAQAIFPGTTYEEVMKDKIKYGKGKGGIFGMMYGGDENTLVRNQGVDIEIAKAAFQNFYDRYPGIRRSREGVATDFGSMAQPGGEGTAVVWREPADYVETFLGFRRHFTLENRICKVLFHLAQAPPKEWKKCPVKVMRRIGRIQTAGGAVSSALYGAAFGIQGQNQRAAGNHKIQSPGAEITKAAQREVWDLQPHGVHELLVAVLNVHDELMTVHAPDIEDQVVERVTGAVERYREHVPLIGMSWIKRLSDWAGKKGVEGSELVKIRHPDMMDFD